MGSRFSKIVFLTTVGFLAINVSNTLASCKEQAGDIAEHVKNIHAKLGSISDARKKKANQLYVSIDTEWKILKTLKDEDPLCYEQMEKVNGMIEEARTLLGSPAIEGRSCLGPKALEGLNKRATDLQKAIEETTDSKRKEQGQNLLNRLKSRIDALGQAKPRSRECWQGRRLHWVVREVDRFLSSPSEDTCQFRPGKQGRWDRHGRRCGGGHHRRGGWHHRH